MSLRSIVLHFCLIFCAGLKGQCHEIFCFRFFNESSSPKPLKITLGSFRFFSKIREDIRKSRCTTAVSIQRDRQKSWKSRGTVPLSWSGKRAQDLEILRLAVRLCNMAIHHATPVSLTNDEKSWPGKTHMEHEQGSRERRTESREQGKRSREQEQRNYYTRRRNS